MRTTERQRHQAQDKGEGERQARSSTDDRRAKTHAARDG